MNRIEILQFQQRRYEEALSRAKAKHDRLAIANLEALIAQIRNELRYINA